MLLDSSLGAFRRVDEEREIDMITRANILGVACLWAV
jgi:hypothetical protein